VVYRRPREQVRRQFLRRLDMLVLLENRFDALVRLHTRLPPAKIGGANDPLDGGNNLPWKPCTAPTPASPRC
jgi:hypothetical protein